MVVEQLFLRNFRNIRECLFEPDRHLNLFIGLNGQGKTSVIEAISFLSALRSFRGAKTEEVIQRGCAQAKVKARLAPGLVAAADPWHTDLEVVFVQDEFSGRTSKNALINGKQFRSSTHYLSQRFGSYQLGFHSIVFNPSDHELVKGSPAERRSYLDQAIAAEDLEYLQTLEKYNRLLKQRNALLHDLDENRSLNPARELLAGFTEPLARFAAVLAYKRLEWIQRLRQLIDNMVHQIAPHQPSLRLVYLSNWVPEIGELSFPNNKLVSVHFSGQEHLPSLEILEQAFWKRLSTLEEAELRARSSLVGPHRDDWAFFLGDHLLKGFGSQGEIRSALLALKLSEIELFRERTGHRPVFLMDDFSSELDRERRNYLLRFLTETDLQVFVTTTEDDSFTGRRFWVSEGVIGREGLGGSPDQAL